jgi:hypothetical protein
LSLGSEIESELRLALGFELGLESELGLGFSVLVFEGQKDDDQSSG